MVFLKEGRDDIQDRISWGFRILFGIMLLRMSQDEIRKGLPRAIRDVVPGKDLGKCQVRMREEKDYEPE